MKVKFYIDPKKLERNYTLFSKFAHIYYPLKTNSNEAVLKALLQLYGESDNGFFVTEEEHYKKLISLGVSPDRMCFGDVLADSSAVRSFYDKGIRYFTFDDIHSLKEFLEYAKPSTNLKIAIRLNIGDVFDVNSHLGASTKECKEMFELLEEHNVNDCGISFYMQKEVRQEGDSFHKMLAYIREEFDECSMSFLNIGGGIQPNDKNIEQLDKVKEELGIREVIAEPGRYLLKDAGYMETAVIRTKENRVILENGIYSGLLDCAIVGKKFRLYMIEEDGTRFTELRQSESRGGTRVQVCGPTLDSLDQIGTYYLDPSDFAKLKKGSKIAVPDAFSYVEELFVKLGGKYDIQYEIIGEKPENAINISDMHSSTSSEKGRQDFRNRYKSHGSMPFVGRQPGKRIIGEHATREDMIR